MTEEQAQILERLSPLVIEQLSKKKKLDITAFIGAVNTVSTGFLRHRSEGPPKSEVWRA